MSFGDPDAWSVNTGGGGNGGGTKTVLGASVTPGQQLSVAVGAGGVWTQVNSFSFATETIPGSSSVGNICKVLGGGHRKDDNTGNFSWYGSGGGYGLCSYYWPYIYSSNSSWYSGSGGSDGSDSKVPKSMNNGPTTGRKGQGTTTRYFGESNGTLYAGGGGGGGRMGPTINFGGGGSKTYFSGRGGEGGGGNGGSSDEGFHGTPGGANTGGGGGGGDHGYVSYTSWQSASSNRVCGSAGGSGICIIRWSGK